jgi:hypothetical protein
MYVLAAIVVAVPLVLMFSLARGKLADSRGRRISRRWRS